MCGKKRLSILSDKKKEGKKKNGCEKREDKQQCSHLNVSETYGIMNVKLVMGPLSSQEHI